MLLGYVRVSSADQNEERQIRALKDFGVQEDCVYIDKKSGKNTDREQLKELLKFSRRGDTVVTESISRIARNTRDLLTIVDDLAARNVEFVSLKEKIDTSTPQGKFMLTVFSAMATLERESILERQREGIAIAKENGVYTGGHKIPIDEKKFRAVCARWRSGEITAVEAQKELGLKANTFYRRVHDYNV